MKVIIPETKLEEILFKYLDVKFKDLEQVKGYYYEIVFRFPNEKFGILGWNRPGDLYIYYKLIDNIFSFIPIEKTEIQEIIGRYVGSRYNLEVIYTESTAWNEPSMFGVDTI
jgi:hypothetical protein